MITLIASCKSIASISFKRMYEKLLPDDFFSLEKWHLECLQLQSAAVIQGFGNIRQTYSEAGPLVPLFPASVWRLSAFPLHKQK